MFLAILQELTYVLFGLHLETYFLHKMLNGKVVHGPSPILKKLDFLEKFKIL